MNQTTIAPVRQSVTVPISADRAFTLFTEGFGTWWIGHHIGAADLADAVIEPRADGRWYERGVDGSECDWGKVLIFEPPTRLVLTWQINGQWRYDPDPDHASEVEVCFAEDGGQTRVDLEHRHIERHGAGAAEVARGVSSGGGWPAILELFAKAAAQA
ncbi:MAG TPA: SRPBCC family protein [Streptosporangiaceae bacterium]